MNNGYINRTICVAAVKRVSGIRSKVTSPLLFLPLSSCVFRRLFSCSGTSDRTHAKCTPSHDGIPEEGYPLRLLLRRYIKYGGPSIPPRNWCLPIDTAARDLEVRFDDDQLEGTNYRFSRGSLDISYTCIIYLFFFCFVFFLCE